jgi:hypothetical protein
MHLCICIDRTNTYNIYVHRANNYKRFFFKAHKLINELHFSLYYICMYIHTYIHAKHLFHIKFHYFSYSQECLQNKNLILVNTFSFGFYIITFFYKFTTITNIRQKTLSYLKIIHRMLASNNYLLQKDGRGE